MNAKRMIAVLAIVAMAFAAFAVLPAADDVVADDKEIVYLHGEITSKFNATADQKVIVDADTVITSNGTSSGWVNINGELIVNEGVTVTIEDGVMNISGDSVINGSIVSKTAGGLGVYPSKGNVITINGSITAIGNATGNSIDAVSISTVSKAEVIVNGTLYVGTNAVMSIIGNVAIASGGKFIDHGDANGAIKLAGYAYFEETSNNYSLTIAISEPSAVIEVVEIMGSISVNDSDMYAYTYGGIDYYVGLGSESELKKAAVDKDFKPIASNQISLSNVKNVKITEAVKTEVKYNTSESKNIMVAETAMTVSALDNEKNVENAADSNVYISIDIGKTVRFDSMVMYGINVHVYSSMTVSGTVVFPLQPNGEKMEVRANNAVLNVDGCVIVEKTAASTGGIKLTNGTINAAHYAVKDEDNKYTQYYMPLQKAIDNKAASIKMMGRLIVENDLTVPAGVSLVTAQGSPDSVLVKKGATFTIADGAKLTLGECMTIEGAFVIENMDYGIDFSNYYQIMSDVMKKDGARIEYSNIYVALSNAKNGDELHANHLSSGILIDEDITIPLGVIFSNITQYGGEVKISVCNGCTLTVDGELQIKTIDGLISALKAGASTDNGWNDKAVDSYGGELREYSVLKVGTEGKVSFVTADYQALYTKYMVPGAYYGADGKQYISNIPLAFGSILDADNRTVNVAGEVSIENINVTGTEKERITVNIIGGDVELKGFTFAYGSVVVSSGVKLTGDIGTSTGKMIFNNAAVPADKTITFEEVFINDAMNLEVRGNIKSDNATEISGIVYLKGFAYDILSSYGTPEYAHLTYAEKIFFIPAGTAVFIEGTPATAFGDVELLIAGEATVMKGATLESDGYRSGCISVLGTFTIEKVDGHAGTVKTGDIYIGGTPDNLGEQVTRSAGNALVTGAGSFKDLKFMTLYFFNGATVSADVLVDWMETDTTKITQFYVDDTVWLTMYCGFKVEYTFAVTDYTGTMYAVTPSLDNAKFNGWQTYDEKTKTYTFVKGWDDWGGAMHTCVGDAGYEKVYASIDRTLYDVTIIADIGIDDIFIDGRNILKDKTSNTFADKVSAGTYTITYTLANGYSGNASIVAIDGKTVSGSGLTFVIDDDKAGTDMKMEITVSGIEKSGYDTDPETHDEKVSGLTTTEILLIVAVIIMAVMAVVLILRLNRS